MAKKAQQKKQEKFVWSQEHGDWINPETGEGLLGEHCITGEKHKGADVQIQFLEEQLAKMTPDARRMFDKIMEEEEAVLMKMMKEYEKELSE